MSLLTFRKVQKNIKTHGAPGMTPEQFTASMKLDEEVKMQPRRIRMKNIGYLTMFGFWYAGVVLFIMYRLRSDDLELLEKEAEERIRVGQYGTATASRKYE